MDLLCGVPKAPRLSKPSNWGSWGKLSLSTPSVGTGPFWKSSTMTRESKGEGYTSGKTVSSSPLYHHLLPANDSKKTHVVPSKDSYNTLFSIPEGKGEFCGVGGFVCGSGDSLPCPLRRSRTLPASAVRRSGASEGKNAGRNPLRETNPRSRDDSAVTTTPSSFRTLKKFRVEALLRHVGGRNHTKETHQSPPDEEEKRRCRVYTISSKETETVEGVRTFRRNISLPAGDLRQESCDGQVLGLSRLPATIGENPSSNPTGDDEVRISPYQVPASTPEEDAAKEEDKYSTLLQKDLGEVEPSTEEGEDPSVAVPVESHPNRKAEEEGKKPSPLPLPLVPEEEEEEEEAERQSLMSSASEVSRLTFGTSTDEGICSIYSETSASLWSSTAPSEASSARSLSLLTKANDDGVSEYSCMSSSASSCVSSFTCSSVSTTKGGAVPKVRSSSFRRCRTREGAQQQGAARPLCSNSKGVRTLCEDLSDDEVCLRCRMETEGGAGSSLRRGGSLRAPKQLPVTPTLLRLLQLGLEQVGGVTADPAPNVEGNRDVTNGVGGVMRREKLHPPRTDPHRLSRANLEESGDVELDAILNELCALENKFNLELSSCKAPPNLPNSTTTITSNSSTANHHLSESNKMPSGSLIQTTNPLKLPQQPFRPKTHVRNGSGGGFKGKFESLSLEMDSAPSSVVARTDSPDNDSAFSDNVSMLSSESSASSGASGGSGITSKQEADKQFSTTDQAAKLKAEKIKMALEKLKEANVKKLFIKAFSHDGSSKSLLVDEKMTVAQVCRMLTDKNHVRVDPKWAIVEHLPDLYMERIYEDDEMLVDNLLMWTRDSKNKLLFIERNDKYDLFFHPETYLLYGNTQHFSSYIDDEARNNLLEEFFSSSRVPEVEGPLFLKSDGKKAWKKFYFVLRQSGLYYCPKGKSSRSSKDLVCLATLENNQVYHGFGWRKKFKAPTDWGLAIKLPHLQAKSSKHIKYLCAEDDDSLGQWVMGIRIAKNGHRLQDNYRSLVEDIAQDDIDRLASSRSFSLASVSASRGPSEATTPSSESRSLDSCLAPSLQEEDGEDTSSSAGSSSQDTPVNTLCRPPTWRQDSLRSGSSSSSSGCLSERSSSTGTPPIEGGFEADFPQQGTIKRKPSSNPKLPLTSTTRHLVKEVDHVEDEGCHRLGSLRHSARRSLSEEVSSLRRRNSSTQGARTPPIGVPTSSSPHPTPAIETPSVDVDSLPPPPPPVDLGPCDPDLLPPPPPELLASTLSLNSLPPPPDEASMAALSGEDLMMASITSLPPPPPPPPCLPKPLAPLQFAPAPSHTPTPPATPPKPKVRFSPQSPPAVAPKPWKENPEVLHSPKGVPTDHPLVNGNGWQLHSPSPPPPPPPPIYAQPQKSPQKKVKKITFLEDVQSFPPSPCPSPPCPPSPSSRPPQPPRRAVSTKLSLAHNPGRLDAPGCKVTPPKSFLNNLQRVMQKKWQVAQKCRDFDKMPHEVLGFRDPLPQVETEKNVGAWIQEHYGRLYENLAPHDATTGPPPPHPPTTDYAQPAPPRPVSQTVPACKKRPPPPPPKRSDTTVLSGRPHS